MILGFMRRRSSQPKPSRSNAPGPKFSIRTSARSTIRLRMARPSGALRSRVTAFLLPFSIRKNQASSSVFSDTMRRPGSPPGGSILMTSAPSQPSICAQLGPASYCVRSSTTIPSSALAMTFSSSSPCKYPRHNTPHQAGRRNAVTPAIPGPEGGLAGLRGPHHGPRCHARDARHPRGGPATPAVSECGGLGGPSRPPSPPSPPEGRPGYAGPSPSAGGLGGPSRPPILLGRVGREAYGRRASPVVGNDVDHRRLAGGRRALQRRPDLVRFLAVLAVRAEVHRHLVVARGAEVASGLVPLGIRGPAAVVADHAQDRDLVTDGRVDLHTVDAERAIAVEHDHLRIGLRDLGADTERQPDAHAPERARVQPMTGHVGRDRLSPVVQDLLAVDHEDRVALEEVADHLADPERMYQSVLRGHLLVHLGGLLRVQDRKSVV